MFQIIQTQKDYYTNSEIQGWRGYVEISVGHYRQRETPETRIDNIRCKGYLRTVFVKLCVQNIENYFFSTQSTLNEDDNNVEEQLNYINLQGNIEKLHDDGWKKNYFTSSDVYMLGFGCGMSQCPQFYVKYLDMYQVSPSRLSCECLNKRRR